MDIMTILGAAGAFSGSTPKAYSAALMAELCAQPDGALHGAEMRGGAVFAGHRDLDFRLRCNAQQSIFALSIVCPNVGRFKLTRKRGIDRWMETFVPARPFRSRNAHFDGEFSVQTRDPEVTTNILANPKNQTLVQAMMQRGCTSIRLEDGRIKAFGPLKSLGALPAADSVMSLLEQLAPLARTAQHFAKHHESRPAVKRDPIVTACWLALCGLGIVGFAALLFGLMHFPVVERTAFAGWCALASLLCVGPTVFGLMLAVQHRSSPYGLVRGMAAASLVAVPAFVSGTLLVVNGGFDTAPTEERVVRILNKSTRQDDKGRTRYRAKLDAWWTSEEARWVRISEETYDTIVPNVTRMRVETHPGWLNREWIADYGLQE